METESIPTRDPCIFCSVSFVYLSDVSFAVYLFLFSLAYLFCIPCRVDCHTP